MVKLSPMSQARMGAAYMADATTGYIRLNRFAASSNEEFNQALDKLRKQGMKHLILDLQGNGGGYLHVACALADEFLGKNRYLGWMCSWRSIPKRVAG